MKTFCQWIKYFMEFPQPGIDYSVVIDKYRVKQFVSPILSTAETYAYFTTVREINDFDFSGLPESFVIKGTHGSGWFMVVNRGHCIDPKYFVNGKPPRFNKTMAIREMKHWLKTQWAIDVERQYRDVVPGVLIEEYLGGDDERHLYNRDYKFNCIHGKVEFIRHCDTLDNHQGYFDTEWNPLPFKRMNTKHVVKDFPKPPDLQRMLEAVEQLLKKINNPPFARVDLYATDKGLYFGEYTFSPSKGNSCRLLPVNPKENPTTYEDYYGDMIGQGILKVVCFKWRHRGGFRLPSLDVVGEYSADHVNRLYRAVKRNLTIPHEFICVTDDSTGIECRTIPMWEDHRELGGCYTRLKLFSREMKQMIGHRFIMLDLDTVIVGNLDKMFSRKADFIMNKYTVRGGKSSKQFYNGSIIMMDAGARHHVWKMFNPLISPLLTRKHKALIGTDQAWISLVLGDGEETFDETDGVHRFQLLPASKPLPKNARIVLFAGNADPSQRSDIPWIKKHWV